MLRAMTPPLVCAGLYFCEVRGAILSRVCDLPKKIATFLRQKNLPYASTRDGSLA